MPFCDKKHKHLAVKWFIVGMLKKYDYIIAGGGCAGLSLGYHLLQSELKHKKVLIVDRSPKTKNDRTWSFWSEKNRWFEEVIYRKWKKLQFKSSEWTHTFDLGNWSYNTIRSIDYYNFILSRLHENSNVEFIFGEIETTDANTEKAWIKVNGQTIEGEWLFDSTFSPFNMQKDEQKYHYIQQHFKGYIIKSSHPVFNPDVPVIFDFNIKQENQARFVYILPFSQQKALVEFTVFSKKILKKEEYDKCLKSYLQSNLQLSDYEIEEEEFGIIPMTDHPMPQFTPSGNRKVHIGTKGGRCKPSTGYAFLRIQEEAENIVKALQKSGKPYYSPTSSKRFLLYDTLLLNTLHHRAGEIRTIFIEMFKNNSINRVFRFLNEESTPLEDLQIMSSVPPFPFLKALYQLKVKRRVS